MEKPAIEGGKPVRENKIYYGRQWISEEDIAAVVGVLKSDYLTCGPKVSELEKKLEEMLDVKHAVAVSNGTAALHCAMMAAGIGEGDEIITTPLTFAASANCALYCGAKVVFADVCEDSYNIDPAKIEECITPRTKAVVAVDFTGQAAQLSEIREVCDRHGLLLVEDAAHSIGTLYDGKPVGGIADMTCFSFHPVKTVTAGEGGAITTNDDDLYRRLVNAHTHGIVKRADLLEEKNAGPWWYEQQSLGYNYRLTDIQSALLISQLERLGQFKARRQEIVKRYDEAFADLSEIIVQKEIGKSDTCRHLYIMQLREGSLRCSRREFFNAMSAEGVQCQVHYIPVYWFPYYRDQGYARGLCPVAEKIYQNSMSLPLYPKMSDADVDSVIASVKKLVEYYRK
ncbi:MAG: UDP-4-amino-4,6-dideoxy-N-acetyl-beta-L-altrosamine transaminase [Lachnospiraceae bacterium]|nr:UDP-4-amino-4,6-dideoxy-N-acetyl-beta-L-altrosamine transaminase [Lachnospiraceae bacterium]